VAEGLASALTGGRDRTTVPLRARRGCGAGRGDYLIVQDRVLFAVYEVLAKEQIALA